MGNAIDTRNEQIKGLVFSSQRQHAIMLPPDQQAQVTGWLSSAFAALTKDQNLAQAALNAPETFITALNDAAQKGLRPGTEEYYLTPRKNKGRMEILGIVGYQGHVEMMYRSGKVASVIVEAVHENDSFEWVPGEMDKPVFRPAGGDQNGWFQGKKARGQLVGAFAYAIMKDGSVSNVVIADADRIAAAKDASAGSHTPYSPWAKHPKSMYMKTAAHDLAKWVPTSAQDLRDTSRTALGETAGGTLHKAVAQADRRPAEPAPQEVIDPQLVEAIQAEEDQTKGSTDTGEVASQAQLAEIDKRLKALGVTSQKAIQSDLEIQIGEGKTLDTLTYAEADRYLASLSQKA